MTPSDGLYGFYCDIDDSAAMNVWLVTIGEELPIVPDIRKARTALLADHLLAKGHKVLWWTSTFDHFKKKHLFDKDTEIDVRDGYKIKALKGSGYRRNISLSRIIDHRLIAGKFRKTAPGMPKPDIIVASLPSYDLAYEAVMYAGTFKVPVLVDLRDQWPDIFLEHVPRPIRGLARVFMEREFFLTREAIRSADGLIAMMDSLLAWGLRYAGREKKWQDRVFYLGFKRNDAAGSRSEKISRLMEPFKGKFIVTFFGTFGRYHNPSIIVKCAEKMKDCDVQFVIAGDGELMKEIRAAASPLPNVSLPGWLNQNEISTLLKYSHVGVCSTPMNAEFFPNKAFVYLSAGLPILSAFRGDIEKFIEEHRIGFSYLPNDADAFAECVKKLRNSGELYQAMSANALRVYDTLLDSDRIYNEYTDHIGKVFDHERRSLHSEGSLGGST